MPRSIRALCLTALMLFAAGIVRAPAGAHGTKTRTLEIVHPWCADSHEPGTRDVIVGMTIRNFASCDDELVSARKPSGESVAVVPAPGSTTGAAIVILRGGTQPTA